MALRRRVPAPPAPVATPERPGGKGRATPKRSEARAQRARVAAGKAAASSAKASAIRKSSDVSDPKVARRLAALERREGYRADRERMKSTDVTRLPAREQVPERIIARDVVDTRWNVANLMIPLAGLFLAAALAHNATVNVVASLGFYVFLLALIVDSVLLTRRITAEVGRRVAGKTTKITAYAVQRSIQPRRIRMPAARVGRGDALPPIPGEKRR